MVPEMDLFGINDAFNVEIRCEEKYIAATHADIFHTDYYVVWIRDGGNGVVF